MHVSRIYGGAIVGGGAAGALIGFGLCLLLGIVTAIQQVDLTGVAAGFSIGLLGALVGGIPGLAVGIGSSIVGSLTALVARMLGERVSTPMMIIAGAVGTVPVTALLTSPFRESYTTAGPSAQRVLVLIGIILVVASIAAVSLSWLFSPRRWFGAAPAPTPERS